MARGGFRTRGASGGDAGGASAARGRGWGQGEGLGRGGGAVDGVSGSLGLAWLLSFVSNSERLSLLPNYRFS